MATTVTDRLGGEATIADPTSDLAAIEALTGTGVPERTAPTTWVLRPTTLVGVLGTAGAWSPAASDGAALGTASLPWSDLFIASGGVVNFANGDVTITHSSNTLTFAGATTGYVFDAPLSATTGTFTGLLSIAGASAGQIAFPATQNPSSDANTLDDYEEGSWIPAFAATSAVFSYGFQGGTYIKVGKNVSVYFQINLNTSGNTLNGNTLTITGLPFTVDSNSKAEFTVCWQNSTTSYISVTGECSPNTTSIALFGLTAAATSNATATVANGLLHATNGSIVYGSVTYYAAA